MRNVAPSLYPQPVSQTLTAGNDPQPFTVGATGIGPFSYQWYYNGGVIAGATGTSLSLFNVPVGTNNYSVIVSSSGGSTTSSNAVLKATNAVAVAAPANMVAWWQAEGNALDSYGLFNGVTNGNTTYVPGKVGQAFNFDGTSGCVFATNQTSLALGRATNLTIECWIKPAALYGHPIVQFSNGTNAGTLLDIYGYGNSLYADLITTNGANYILGAPWNIVNSNTWQHAALTYDGTNAMIYYNGQPVLTNYLGATNNLLLQTIQYGYGIYLGCQPGGTPVFYAGLMDEVSIYTRALSTNEILGIYNASTAGKSNLPPVIASQPSPTNQTVAIGFNTSYSVTVGSGSPPFSYQWQFNGSNLPGATNATYTLPFVEASQGGNYQVTVTNLGGSVTSSNVALTASNEFEYYPLFEWPGAVWIWGTNNFGQSAPTAAMTNIAAVAAGYYHTLVLQQNGTVVGWGDNAFGETTIPPARTSNVLAIAAGNGHSLALKMDGTVAAWGNNSFGQTSVPGGLTNIIAIAAGGFQSLALSNNGTITAWGTNYAPIPSSLTNGTAVVTAIAAGDNFCLALLSNGTVTAWGSNELGQTSGTTGLTGIVAIAAGGEHALALKADGTVSAWGDTQGGILNVPSGLNNDMAIAAGYYHTLVINNHSTVRAWGTNNCGQSSVLAWLGGTNGSGVKYTGFTGQTFAKSIAAGKYHSVALQFSPLVQYYPMTAANDLLLVYSTNSNTTYSSAIMNYYLTNRPMAATANTLAINCTTNEIFLPADYTNIFAAQVQTWLAANPTKRPQYVILFPEIPSRVNYDIVDFINSSACPANTNQQPSVQYQLAMRCQAGWTPFVTSINMNNSNDCIAYVNKLAMIGKSTSAGTLLLSASAGGYTNTNYYLDDIRYGGIPPYEWDNYSNAVDGNVVSYAIGGLLQNGVSSNSILFLDGLEINTNGIPQNLPHITNGTNVAGYMSWGVHSSLGNGYATNATPPRVTWSGNSGWYIMGTVESVNGQRYQGGQGDFVQWFSSGAFGGTSYANTPVGAVTHVEEPCLTGIENSQIYFGSWAAGYNFGICAWNSRNTPYFQAVGDPLVKK